MRKQTKILLIASTLTVSLAAAPALLAQDGRDGGAMQRDGMMGREGMMGNGGMMGMMGSMMRMMDQCSQMMADASRQPKDPEKKTPPAPDEKR